MPRRWVLETLLWLSDLLAYPLEAVATGLLVISHRRGGCKRAAALMTTFGAWGTLEATAIRTQRCAWPG